jgi:hypothetical protein
LVYFLSGAPKNPTPAFEWRQPELPGGFDPVPQFDRIRTELEFRGGQCASEAEGAYRLVRPCPE